MSGDRLPHDWFDRELPANVQIGEGSWCYSAFAFLHYRSTRPRGVVIGRNSGVYAGTFFELGPTGEVDIGNWCTVVGAIIATNSRVAIGDHSFIAHQVVLTDAGIMTPPDINIPDGLDTPAGPGITIGTNAWIGARAVILGGVRIGDDAVVGAGAVVSTDVPSGAVAAGNPSRVVGSVDRRS